MKIATINAIAFTSLGAAIGLIGLLAVGDALAAPPKKCSLTNQNPEECISPTFPNEQRGPCARGACYLSGHHKHKKHRR